MNQGMSTGVLIFISIVMILFGMMTGLVFFFAISERAYVPSLVSGTLFTMSMIGLAGAISEIRYNRGK